MYIIFPFLFEISIFVINIMLKENCGVSGYLHFYTRMKRESDGLVFLCLEFTFLPFVAEFPL